MDGIVGYLAERIALQIKAARDAEAEQRRLAEAIATKNAGSVVARTAPPGPQPPLGVARTRDPRSAGARPASIARTPVAPGFEAVPSPAPASGIDASRVPKPRTARVNLDDAFPSSVDAPGGAPRAVSTNPLLAAFGGGESLLAALVLSEALASPVALRNGPPHRP